ILDNYEKVNKAMAEAKNIIYNYRDKIGFAINQSEDLVKDFINDELSALETDFILLKGELKLIEKAGKKAGDDAKKLVIDFFNQYSSVPQLKHAKVYITSLTKLVEEELPVG